MECFQKALMLNQNHIQSLQLRGMMLYHHGSLQEAVGNFKVMAASHSFFLRTRYQSTNYSTAELVILHLPS